MPVLSINMFETEDIVTTSGADNLSLMENEMKEDGYSVKTFDLSNVKFVG